MKDGEAESYENVTVRYVAGRQAIMTIYEGGNNGKKNEVERVALHTLKTKQEMHDLIVAKGFRLKPDHEVAAIREEHWQQIQKEREQREKALGQRAEARRTALERNREQRERLGLSPLSPPGTPHRAMLIWLYGGFALLLLTAMGVRRNRRRRKAVMTK